MFGDIAPRSKRILDRIVFAHTMQNINTYKKRQDIYDRVAALIATVRREQEQRKQQREQQLQQQHQEEHQEQQLQEQHQEQESLDLLMTPCVPSNPDASGANAVGGRGTRGCRLTESVFLCVCLGASRITQLARVRVRVVSNLSFTSCECRNIA